MSCPSATAPINISKKSSSGKCDLKCAYSFQYKESLSTLVKNRGEYVSLSYAEQSGMIKYNTQSYSVREVRLYHPSLHEFEGMKYDGEMIIVHNNLNGGHNLLVCIPIRISSDGLSFFTAVMDALSTRAPSSGDSTLVNETFNLEEIVPKKPFYAYSATIPYQPCDFTTNYVVFTKEVPMTSTDYALFESVIEPNAYDIKSDPSIQFFYNEQGPGVSRADGIYIDCRMVGQSEDTTTVFKSPVPNMNSWQGVTLILCTISLIIVFLIITRLISFLTTIN